MKKPEKCCELGSYEHCVDMPLKGRRQGIDICVSDLVAVLNAGNIPTVWSCCGHGKMNAVIGLEDGRHLVVMSKNEIDKFFNALPEAEGKED